ncbi:NAD(P)-binding domain-containing protein [Streptomyces sp. 5-10]|uniref:NAD(P)-binding domain-containing protein n=1 Tax=Streptomyces sp. 5-10 TaxID=878925 RepID=UPI00295EE72E|nr:NAD(P)-binding domain-containing protein [Streptomyces sp. 5-10]
MRIGTLGAGQIATAVARHALRHGHEVVLSNSRGPRALAEPRGGGPGAAGRAMAGDP